MAGKRVEIIVKDENGNPTAWFGVGEMDMVDVLDLEEKLAALFLGVLKGQKTELA
jgi:hypothetical protein